MSSLPPDGSPLSPRWADLWQRSRHTQAQLNQAYARFQRRSAPRRRPRARDVVAWMGAGMLVGMGSLYAATSARDRWHQPAPPVHASASPPRVSSTPLPPPAPGSTNDAPAPSASMQRALPPPSGSPIAGTAATSTKEQPSPESWQRAARGLRESDFDAADDALLKLSHQGSQAERDIAKLVRAQVLLRQRRIAEARVLLGEVANSTASATARAKATRLLEQSSPHAASHRSFEMDAATDSP